MASCNAIPDVFLATDDKDNELVIKLHRLGRISFRQIKNKRDYLLHRKSASWLYVIRVARHSLVQVSLPPRGA